MGQVENLVRGQAAERARTWGQIGMSHGPRSKHYHTGTFCIENEDLHLPTIVLVYSPALDGTPDHISCQPSFQNTPESSLPLSLAGARCLQSPPSCVMSTIRKCQHLTPFLQCHHLHLVSKTFNGQRQSRLIQGLAAERDFLRVIVATNNANIVGFRLITNLTPTPSYHGFRSSSSKTFTIERANTVRGIPGR